MRTGRPKNKAAMSKEDFCAFVERVGSQRKAAKALRIDPVSVRRFITGRSNVPQWLADRMASLPLHPTLGGVGPDPLYPEFLRAHCMPIKNPEKTIIRISRSGPTPLPGEYGVISRGCGA